MIHPSYVELMKVVNDGVEIGEEPVVTAVIPLFLLLLSVQDRSLQALSL